MRYIIQNMKKLIIILSLLLLSFNFSYSKDYYLHGSSYVVNKTFVPEYICIHVQNDIFTLTVDNSNFVYSIDNISQVNENVFKIELYHGPTFYINFNTFFVMGITDKNYLIYYNFKIT